MFTATASKWPADVHTPTEQPSLPIRRFAHQILPETKF